MKYKTLQQLQSNENSQKNKKRNHQTKALEKPCKANTIADNLNQY